jgi:hypothetical protein
MNNLKDILRQFELDKLIEQNRNQQTFYHFIYEYLLQPNADLDDLCAFTTADCLYFEKDWTAAKGHDYLKSIFASNGKKYRLSVDSSKVSYAEYPANNAIEINISNEKGTKNKCYRFVLKFKNGQIDGIKTCARSMLFISTEPFNGNLNLDKL